MRGKIKNHPLSPHPPPVHLEFFSDLCGLSVSNFRNHAKARVSASRKRGGASPLNSVCPMAQLGGLGDAATT